MALLAGAAMPAHAVSAQAPLSDDPLMGVVTTAGDTGSSTERTESAQRGTGPGMAMTGTGVAAGGGVALGVVAVAGGGSQDGEGGDGDGDDQDSGSDSELDGGGDPSDAESPDDVDGPSEPDEEEVSEGPLSMALMAQRRRRVALAGGGRLTLARRGAATALHASVPLGEGGDYLTLTTRADPGRSGGFYAWQAVPADLVVRPGVMGAQHLQAFERLSGVNASWRRGSGRVRLAAFAGQPADGPAWSASQGAVAAAGYDVAAPAWRMASDVAVTRTTAGEAAVSTGTRFAVELSGGTSFLAGASAHAGDRRERGTAVVGVTAEPPMVAGRRLGLMAARTWAQATERAGMSKTSGNGFHRDGGAAGGRFSLQAFWQESLGARAELGLGTHWAPAYGDRPEHSAAASFVAKLTGDF